MWDKFTTDGECMAREVTMKNALFTIALCLFLGACSTQPQARHDGRTLLSFDDLANEITVGFKDIDETQAAVVHPELPLGTP
jgi:uncharacterized lipoprotein YajG